MLKILKNLSIAQNNPPPPFPLILRKTEKHCNNRGHLGIRDTPVCLEKCLSRRVFSLHSAKSSADHFKTYIAIIKNFPLSGQLIKKRENTTFNKRAFPCYYKFSLSKLPAYQM